MWIGLKDPFKASRILSIIYKSTNICYEYSKILSKKKCKKISIPEQHLLKYNKVVVNILMSDKITFKTKIINRENLYLIWEYSVPRMILKIYESVR